MVDVNETTAAREAAENLVWRLEVLQHRCRYNIKTGEYRKLPTRIRRFANAKPTDVVAAVVEELVKMAPYRGVVFCGEDDQQLSYRPTATSIRKDDSLKTGSRDATYTIVQDLLLDGEPDTYLGTDGSSCSQVSSVEYYWDEADVVACPPGEQGVVYQVADVSRDRETDLFSFKVRKVQAVTQHLPEHVTECSDESQKTVETWDNVYGEPGAYRYDSVVHGGEAISLPAPCSAGRGGLVQVDVAENPDCTFKVSVTRVTSKVDYGAFLRYRDQFQIRTMDLWKNEQTRLSRNGVEYSGGVKTTYESESNPDGTFNNRITKETERGVSKSVYGYSVSPRYAEVTWTDANQPSAARSIPSGYAYGSWRYTKTPGGLFNNEFTGVKLIASSLGYQCSDTAFLHTHGTSSTLTSFPGTGSHVAVAGGGVVRSETVDRDDRGVITKRTEVRTEHGVKDFSRRVTSTLLGQTVEVRHRSQPSRLADPAKGSIGGIEYEMTEGRLFNLVSRTFIKANPGLFLGSECSRTVFEHTDMKEATSGSEGQEAQSAGGGRRYQVRYVVDTDTGSIRQQDTTTEELAFPQAVVAVQGTARATIVTTTSRNMRTTAASVAGKVANVGESRKGETNPGGSVDVTDTKVTPRLGEKVSESCEVDVTQHVHTSETVDDGKRGVADSIKAGDGKYMQRVLTVDDNGVKSLRQQDVSEFNHVFGSRVHEDAMQAHQIIETTSGPANPGALNGVGTAFSATEDASQEGNESNLPDSATGALSGGAGRSPSVLGRGEAALEEHVTESKTISGGGFTRGTQYVADSELTKGGRYHSRKYKYVPKPQKWLDAIVAVGNGGQYVWHFRNLTQAQCKTLVDDTLLAIEKQPYKWYACKPYVRRAMNDFGLYDGDIGFECRDVSGGGTSGSTGGDPKPEGPTKLYDWWEKDIHVKCESVLDPNDPNYSEDEDVRFLVQTRWSHYETGTGQGRAALQSFMNSHSGAFWSGVRISYNASSQYFVYTKMIEQKTKVDLVKGNTPTSTTLLEKRSEVDDLGSHP